ncbi:bifunctional (p)ppGpp synthetase/guanosine-3',5'-bis(diphosphate) 3'-pyrophosphohydrolase [Candidatus Bathyarchaeota archaeon]|nr:bifunctional (p)ppGpp synthetase/guanosine-3',5'-bis(diphosphate) 3'-pyrophosphohydrolase [Candidatus Bathyarchaeota archaeon]
MVAKEGFVEAFIFSFRSHMGKCRKGTKVHYIVHPLDVASILMKNEAPEVVVIAGLLHDVMEDEGVKVEEIKEKFGVEVAELVEGASEPEQYRGEESSIVKKETWKTRKTHTIATIKKASYNLKLLSCADKLANIRDMITEFEERGESFWEKFNASKEDQAWYYYGMLEALTSKPHSLEGTVILKQLQRVVTDLFKK